MRIATLIALMAAFCAKAPAGDTYVPDPAPSGICNVIPFSPTFLSANGEWRYQAVLPAATLGSQPLTITGLSLAPCASDTFTATLFEVRMNNLTPNQHTTNMDANIGPAPTVVRNAGPFTWAVQNNSTWQAIKLDCPHVFDGASDLVIEVRFSGAMSSANIGMQRAGAAQRYYAAGIGAYSASMATGSGMAAFKVRLTHADVTPNNTMPSVGSLVNLAFDSYPDAGQIFIAASSFAQAPIRIGCWSMNLLPDGLFKLTVNNSLPSVFVNYQGFLDANGQATASVVIPQVPSLAGLPVHTAFATFDTGLRSISSTGSFLIVP